jgi:hypothetical protein
MAYLHNFFELQFLCDVGVCLPGIQTGYSTKIRQFIVSDIGPVLFCEKIGVNPIPASFGKQDGTVQILAQALLEDTATQIDCLTQYHLPDGRAKFRVRDARLPRCSGKPSRLENPFRSSSRVWHISSIAPGAIELYRKIISLIGPVGLGEW